MLARMKTLSEFRGIRWHVSAHLLNGPVNGHVVIIYTVQVKSFASDGKMTIVEQENGDEMRT